MEQVKLKWKNLSDGFKKCLDRKRDLEKSGCGYSKVPTCRFYNQLLFLRDSVSNRTTHSNVQVRSISPVVTSSFSNKSVPEPPTQTPEPPPPTSQPPTPTPDLHIGDETCQPVQNQQQPVTATAQPPATPKLQFPQATVIPKKKKKVVLDPVEEYLIKSIEKKEDENKLLPAKKEDADVQFCQSIAHTLRRLGEQSMKKNQLAKIKIQQLLFDIEFED